MTSNPPRLATSERPATLFTIVLTGVIASGGLGAVTNAINADMCPGYFHRGLSFASAQDLWRASIARGLLEGLLWGVVYSTTFAAFVGVVSRATCPFLLALRYQLGVVGGALAGWFTGGLAGVGLAALSPAYFQATFRQAPSGYEPLLRFAWVGGSIWGLLIGGGVALVIVLIAFRAAWLRRTEGHPPRLVSTGLSTDATPRGRAVSRSGLGRVLSGRSSSS